MAGRKNLVFALDDDLIITVYQKISNCQSALDLEQPPKCYIDAYLQEVEKRKRNGEEIGRKRMVEHSKSQS